MEPPTYGTDAVAGAWGLYGAGQTGRRVLDAIRSEGGEVRFFLDATADRLREIAEVPVLNPSGGSSRERGVPIVITVFNRDSDVGEIVDRLRAYGYRTITPYISFHRRLRHTLGDHFWLGDPTIVDRETTEIARVERLWEDEESRGIFRALVELYRTRDPGAARRPTRRQEEYVPADIPGWLPNEALRMVDGGAFDGDTLAHFRRSGVQIEAAACFEPDPENLRKLQERVTQWDAEERRGLLVWPCGLAERTGTFSFAGEEGEASHLATESHTGNAVACVTLDDALPGFEPNLVKLDVEGAEEAALNGAKELIGRNRPRLAISVYHRPTDLWRLPALVADWNLGYTLHLRSYGFNGFDTVCYAVP